MQKTETLTRFALAFLLTLSFAVFSQADEAPSPLACPVRFAVLGDRTGDHVPGVYGQIVAEIEWLKPEFVITVGDMIEGYTEDTSVLIAEWEELLSLVEPLSMPIYFIPGNHDITTDPLVGLYRLYVGEPVYSFDYRNLHFAILDNSRWDSSEELPGEQIDWLIGDLTQHAEAAFTFVFIHKPFWYNTTALGKPDTLHSLFRNYGVDAVFTGHFHRYFTGQYDGIIYTGIGSSGGGMRPGPSELGYHFAWVTVDDKQVSIAPIKIGSVVPWDDATAADLHMVEEIDRSGITFGSSVPVSEDLTVAGADVTVEVHNLSGDFILEDTIRWHAPEGWSVQPSSRSVTVQPEKTEQISFRVSCEGDLYPVPTLSVGFPYKEDRTHSVEEDLLIARQVLCRQTASPPVIDGELTETMWSKPESRFFSPDGSPVAIDSAYFYFAYDRENLYLAAHCKESRMDSLHASVTEHDGAVYGEDCIGYFFQPDIREDTVYQIYVNPLGVVFDQKISWNADGYYDGDRDFNGSYEVRTTKGDGFWEIEVRIPLTEIGAKAESGQKWGVNFRRKQKRFNSASDWQAPIDYDPKTFGVLQLE